MNLLLIFAFLCAAIYSPFANAADPFLDFGLGRPPGQAGNSLDYAGQISPMTGVNGPNMTPSVLEQQLRGTFLLHKDSTDVWSLNAKTGLLYTSSQFVIPTEQPVPQDLWDASFGMAYSHKIDAKHDSGFNFSIGSASDAPEVIRDMYVTSTYTYRFPCGSQSCIFFVNESTNRTFLNFIPIPGLAYIIHSEKLDAVLGLPFALVNWRPTAHWSLTGTLFGPTAVSSEVGYLPVAGVRALQIYSGFSWGQQLWATENRPSYATRLFYERAKAGVGFRAPVFQPVKLDLFGGYEFDRRFFQADSGIGAVHEGADLDASWFVQLKLGIYSL